MSDFKGGLVIPRERVIEALANHKYAYRKACERLDKIIKEQKSIMKRTFSNWFWLVPISSWDLAEQEYQWFYTAEDIAYFKFNLDSGDRLTLNESFIHREIKNIVSVESAETLIFNIDQAQFIDKWSAEIEIQTNSYDLWS